MTGGVTQTGPSTFVKTSGTDNVFDGQVYSQQGYARGVYVTATASQSDSDVIFGLNSDPAADAGFASTDYAWYILGDGPGTDYQCEIRESGIYVSAHGSHIGSTFTITYDGANIRYFKDGSLIRTVARAIGSALYLDSSFSNVGGGLTSLNFGPMGEVGGATTITATNDTTTTTLYPVMVGAAGSSEVPKVTTTKLSFNASSGSLSAVNTSVSGTMTLPTGAGNNYIKAGTGDGASFTTYNLKINSWWGIGFGDYQDLSTVKAYLDTRNGHLGLSGALGVGTTASATNGEIRATNNITAYYGSDRRLKTKIVNILDPITKLKKINGVTFDWTDEEIARRGGIDEYFVRKHDVGVIAQEIEEVLPEIVATRLDGFKAVQYEKIVPLLIEAIKELSDQVDDMRKQIEELKNK
jgi:hypothetical protein